MSETVDNKIAELQESDAYNDKDHPMYDQAVTDMQSLMQEKYGTGASQSTLDQKMADAMEELQTGKNKTVDPERRLDNPVVEGEPKFGMPMKRDEQGNEVTIMDRPDLYVLKDDIVTIQDKIDDIETEADFDKVMQEIQPKWDRNDQVVMDALMDFAEAQGVDMDAFGNAFKTYVQSSDFGKTYSEETGMAALIQNLGGDEELAIQIADRAASVVMGISGEQFKTLFVDTGLQNNPTMIGLLASMAEGDMGSAVDDIRNVYDPDYEV